MLASSSSDSGICDLLVRYASPGVLVDVGGYHGDFTKRALATGLFSRAFVFEPNPENIAVLTQAFPETGPVEIVAKAVSAAPGRSTFRFGTDLTTGSLLPYADPAAPAMDLEVDIVSLDSIRFERPVSVIKIDTQGGDLDVLEGASQVIAAHAPIIIAELIFAPLYDGQTNPFDLMQWLAARGYALTGFYNEHYGDGWLAFADAIFIPRDRAPAVPPHFEAPPEHSALQGEIDMLRRVCEERLELINRLDRDLRRATGAPARA